MGGAPSEATGQLIGLFAATTKLESRLMVAGISRYEVHMSAVSDRGGCRCNAIRWQTEAV